MLKLGEILFKFRDYTPIPFVIVMIIYSAADMNSLIAGTCITIFGELIRMIGVSHIGGVSRTKTYSTGQKLITSGPFSYVRNPLYIGNFFLTGGLVVASNIYIAEIPKSNVLFTVVFIAFFILQYTPIIRWEENNLRNIFGAEFETYVKQVPRWIPAIIPKIKKQETIKGDLKAAIFSEKNTLMAAILMYVLILWRSGWLY